MILVILIGVFTGLLGFLMFPMALLLLKRFEPEEEPVLDKFFIKYERKEK